MVDARHPWPLARLLLALGCLLAAACDGGPAPVEVPQGFAADADVTSLLEEKRAAALASPSSADAHLDLGLALSVNEGADLAEICFQNALSLDPDHVEARYQLAELHRGRGDTAAQIAELRRALELDGAFHAARFDLGCALLDEGDLAGAEAAFEELLRQVPDYPLAELGLGLVALDQGDAAAASVRLRRMFAAHPDDPFVRMRLGQACADLGRDEEAAWLLESVNTSAGRPRLRSPGTRRSADYRVSAGARLSRANDLLLEGKSAEALPFLEELHGSAPSDFPIGMSLVAACLELGRSAKAMEVIEQMARVRPEHHLPPTQESACHLLLAEEARRAGRRSEVQEHLEAALRCADEAVSRAEDFGKGHLRRASTLAALRRDGEALAAFRRAIQLGETEESVYREMMGPAEREGGVSATEEVLREGIAVAGDRLRLRFELCGVYLRTSRGAEARAAQRDMARRAPGHPLTARADQILRKNGL